MTARTPVTRMSLDSSAATGPRLVEGLLAPVESLIAAACESGASTGRRLRLLGAVGRRVDELFALRAGALRGAEGSSAARRLRLRALLDDAHALWTDEVVPALRARGTAIETGDALGPRDRSALDRVFAAELSPLLTPLTVDAAHPFPAVASLALNLAVSARDRRTGAERYIGIEIPPKVSRWLRAAGSASLVPVERLIGMDLPFLLPDLEVLHQHPFRVTRAVGPLRARGTPDGLASRTQPAVRLEVDAAMPPAQRALLVAGLGLDAGDVDAAFAPLDLAALATLPARRARATIGAGAARERGGEFRHGGSEDGGR